MQKNFIRLRYSNEFQSNNYDFQTKAAELAKVSDQRPPCWRKRPCAIVITKGYKHNFKFRTPYLPLKLNDQFANLKTVRLPYAITITLVSS